MSTKADTPLERQILAAVSAGGTRCHLKYLPEVLALVSKRKIRLVVANSKQLEVAKI